MSKKELIKKMNKLMIDQEILANYVLLNGGNYDEHFLGDAMFRLDTVINSMHLNKQGLKYWINFLEEFIKNELENELDKDNEEMMKDWRTYMKKEFNEKYSLYFDH